MLGPARVFNAITPPFQNPTVKEKESYMTTRYSNIPMLAAASMAVLLIAGGSTPALATCTVNGGAFLSIQAAVNAGQSFISFTGTCDPFVFINHPVELLGTGATAANNIITQGITVQGTQRVFIFNAQIGGDTSNPDTSGVTFIDGANVTVGNSNIESTVQGVNVIRGSIAIIRNSAIQGRAASALNDVSNVFAGDHSMILLTNTSITMNEDNGKIGTLEAGRNSSLRLGGGNIITNTGSLAAIDLFENSSLRQFDPGVDASPPFDGTPDAINGGMSIGSKSIADVRDLTISGDVTVDLDSVFRVSGGDGFFGAEPQDILITGNITASRQSIIAFESPLPTVNGNITCKDTQSHLSGKAVFNGTVNCLGFTPLSNQGNQP
jgi:hypothetical protein